MNREIKFRAWHKGRMRPISIINNCGHAGSVDSLDFETMTAQVYLIEEPIPVMQYTGLEDKNGFDIYEGDIVKCGYGTGKVSEMLGCWVVVWIDDTEAESEFLGLNKKVRRGREDDERFEVIGNIHANPELLKGGSNA